VNPNSSAAATAAMLDIARTVAGPNLHIDDVTAGDGPGVITDPKALDHAADRVVALTPALTQADGVIVAGFGDPGLAGLRAAGLRVVTGLAEAGMAEAATDGWRFAVVTTTSDLVARIAQSAQALGHAGFAGTWVTPGDPLPLMAHPERLAAALLAACRRACAEEPGIRAIVIGGGPLALAARIISADAPVPLVEPLPAAVRRILSMIAV